MNSGEKENILEIRGLSVTFRQYRQFARQKDLPVIRSLDVTVGQGEIVAVVGASGSGKSLLAHSIMGLLPSNARVEGEMIFLGQALTPERMKKVRGKEIALVPQGVTYLDPLMKVGDQVRERTPGRSGRKRQEELFSAYGLPKGTENQYPFACSGGMSRRILLATALMERPRLIVADEPTPGMDAEQGKQAMADFRRFADEGNGVLLITHDIELAVSTADRVAVFYGGMTVEEASAADFADVSLLRHPYTRALWKAMPGNGFTPLPGTQPYPGQMPAGCVFGPRCPEFTEACLCPIPLHRVRGGMVRCLGSMEKRNQDCLHPDDAEGEKRKEEGRYAGGS